MKNHLFAALNTTITTTTISAAMLLSGMTLAQAHVSLEIPQVTANSNYKAVLRIPHGCGGQPTTQVKVTLPEGFIAAQPQAKAGWTIETSKSDYKETYQVHGKPVTSGITEIIWKDGNLPSDFFDDFIVLGKIAPFETATTLTFPVIQSCEGGTVESWTEIAANGQDPHALKNPAPQLAVSISEKAPAEHGHNHGSKAADGHHAVSKAEHGDHTATEAVNIGDLSLSGAYSVATIPNAPVAGGYLQITNHGTSDDRLLGGTTDAAGKLEIHEMSMQNDVMKMRKLPEPLSIPAGKTVELSPNGFHIMFMKLAKPFTQGETIKVTLEFEKAGKVELPFHVNPANSANEHSQH